MAYNSAYTGSQVDAAVGAVRQKETKWDNKQDELTGTEDQIVGFNSAGEAVAVAKPDPLPTGGETGQVLTKTAEGTAWDDIPSDLPAGGTDGQILTKTAEGVAWEDAPESGVTSFKGRTGAVTPQEGDYTADMVGARPDTWTPTASDVGAATPADVEGAKPMLRTATLTTSGWSSNSQTVTVNGVVANSSAQLIYVSPANKDSATAWGEAGVFCSAQGANSLTFVCDSTPSANISVNISIQEART